MKQERTHSHRVCFYLKVMLVEDNSINHDQISMPVYSWYGEHFALSRKWCILLHLI